MGRKVLLYVDFSAPGHVNFPVLCYSPQGLCDPDMPQITMLVPSVEGTMPIGPGEMEMTATQRPC